MKEECSDPAASGQLTGQLAVITGASRGVGAEIARVYAREGALVVVNFFKSKDKGEAVAAEIGPRALALYGDVTVKEDLVKLVTAAEAHFGKPVSVVVNNALAHYQFNPGSSMASIKTVSPDDLEQQMKGTLAGGCFYSSSLTAAPWWPCVQVLQLTKGTRYTFEASGITDGFSFMIGEGRT